MKAAPSTRTPLDPLDPFWRHLRGLYPLLGHRTYLNNASIQPLPRPVAEAVREFARRASEEDPEALYDPALPGLLREELAPWLGCRGSDLALASSTSDGLLKAVNAIPWREGDEAVLPHNEFPSVTYPLRMAEGRGVRLRLAGEEGRPVREEEILAAVTPRTRAAAFSWVSFSTGWRMDLRTLSAELKRRGVEFVLVDGMQGAGLWNPRLRETEVDFFAFQAVKWMAGPNGAGALYVRPGAMGSLRDSALSWYSVPCCEDFSLLTRQDLSPFPSARRFDGGTPPWINLVGLRAWLALLAEAGIASVERRMEHLLSLLHRVLSENGLRVFVPPGACPPTAIVLLDLPDGERAFAALKEAGVSVSFRMGRVRLSPHVYNDGEDFARLAEVLRGGT